VGKPERKLALVLDRLEEQYGKLEAPWPLDAYEMIVWTNCGYPASEAKCKRGFEALKREIGLKPEQILAAPPSKLAKVMRLSVMLPELCAERLKEIAWMVKKEFGGDLSAAMKRPLLQARKILKKFPVIGDPGADKILLFTKTAPVAAVPSNCIDVPLRLGFGREMKNYAASYRSVQEAIAAELPESFEVRQRAYLLLKRHGQELCKRSKPLCEQCPLTAECAYFQKGRKEWKPTYPELTRERVH